MANNSNLGAARNAKNDEFYTQYSDIEAEMNAYIEYNPEVFKDKTIFLPCDDPEWSNFTKYFASNFTRLGIKKNLFQPPMLKEQQMNNLRYLNSCHLCIMLSNMMHTENFSL